METTEEMANARWIEMWSAKYASNKCKASRGEEEVVHRMKLDAAKLGKNKDNEKEEQQGNRRKVTDLTGKRSGLQPFRHGQGDVVSRNQVLIIPAEFPAITRGVFFRG